MYEVFLLCDNLTLLGYARALVERFGGPGKSWKSPGIFCMQESGNPELR